MASRLSLSQATIEGEVDRYIALPAQALGYQIALLKFRELRVRAEGTLGERFNLRRFHDMLMGAGPVTLPVLDNVIEAWLPAEREFIAGEPTGRQWGNGKAYIDVIRKLR